MNLKKLKKDIIPFGEYQQAIIFLIIACVFQFLLFFSPYLASEVVAKELEQNTVKLSFLFKSDKLDENVFKFLNNNKISDPIYTNKQEDNKIEVKNEEFKMVREKREVEKINVVATSIHTITAYNSLPEQTNDQPCITANGFNVCNHGIEDTIAANFLPFGTKVRIPELFGDRIFIVRDRMNQRFPNRVDIWMLDRGDAINFGIKQAEIEIIEIIQVVETVV